MPSDLDLPALRRKAEAVNPLNQIWVSARKLLALITAAEERDSLRAAVETVLKNFQASEAQGYHSRDRQYAIEMLTKALSRTSPPPDRVGQIVAYLWKEAESWREVKGSAGADAARRALSMVAYAIERGDHRKGGSDG